MTINAIFNCSESFNFSNAYSDYSDPLVSREHSMFGSFPHKSSGMEYGEYEYADEDEKPSGSHSSVESNYLKELNPLGQEDSVQRYPFQLLAMQNVCYCRRFKIQRRFLLFPEQKHNGKITLK